jgi:hypothetical protein
MVQARPLRPFRFTREHASALAGFYVQPGIVSEVVPLLAGRCDGIRLLYRGKI